MMVGRGQNEAAVLISRPHKTRASAAKTFCSENSSSSRMKLLLSYVRRYVHRALAALEAEPLYFTGIIAKK